MKSTFRPPPLQLHPISTPPTIILSPQDGSPATPYLSRFVLLSDGPSWPPVAMNTRRHKLLGRTVAPATPLSPVTETDESNKPPVAHELPYLKAELQDLLEEIDQANADWKDIDEEQDPELADIDAAQLIEVRRESIVVALASPVSPRPSSLLPSSPTSPFHYARYESSTDQDKPSSEWDDDAASIRSSSSLGRLLSDFPLPPSTIPIAETSPLTASSSQSESFTSSPSSLKFAAKDAFLHPRQAPKPPVRTSSAPDLSNGQVVKPSLSSLALRNNRKTSRSPSRSYSDDSLPPSSSSPMTEASSSPSPTSNDRESSWRETIDSIFSKPPVPPRPGPDFFASSLRSPPLPLFIVPSPRSSSLPLLSSSSATEDSPSLPSPISPINNQHPRSILKNRTSDVYAPLHSPRSASSLAHVTISTSPPFSPMSPISPPPTPFVSIPDQERKFARKPPTPPRSQSQWYGQTLPSPALSTSSSSSSSAKTRNRSHSSADTMSSSPMSPFSPLSAGFPSPSYTRSRRSHEYEGENDMASPRSSISSSRSGVKHSSSSSSHSGASESGHSSRRSRSRSGSEASYSSSRSRSSTTSSSGGRGMPARAAIPIELLIRS